MSIQSEITRISGNVSDSLDAVAAKGVTVPAGSNSDDLPSLIQSISTGGAVTSVNGETGDVVLTTSDLTNDSGYITGMTILSYGSSTWNDFITAYNANKVVYCRASSNSNPASGAQTRLAFMAYVNSSPPTEVEFQYYRSVSTHSDSQQGDQVYVYKLNSSGTWSVTVREAYSKIAVGTGISKSYNNGTITLSNSLTFGDLAFENDASASYTPAGSVSKPNITVTPTTASVTPISTVGSLPSFSATVSGEVLTLSYTDGTLPTAGTAVSVLTDVSAELSAEPTFTGTAATITVS